MTDDAAIVSLARRAGIAPEWEDYAGKLHIVSIESIKRILTSLGLPCGTRAEVSHSRQTLEPKALPLLVTATVGEPINLPISLRQNSDRIRISYEDGTGCRPWRRMRIGAVCSSVALRRPVITRLRSVIIV